MKKQVLAMIFVLALSLTILAGCGGNNTNSGTGGNSPASTASNPAGNNATTAVSQGAALTPSITPASGFVKNDKDTTNLTYNKTSSDGTSAATITIMTHVLDGMTVNNYAVSVRNELKDSFKDAVFSDITNTTIGGMAAVEFTYTSTKVGQKARYDFITKDGTVYSILCMATDPVRDAAALYDNNAAAFQSMLDSFTLQ